MKSRTKIKSTIIWGKLILGISMLTLSSFAYGEDIPNIPSEVYINAHTNVLYVQKPNGVNKPYLIKGVSWAAATRAPAYGPDPLNPDGFNADNPENTGVQYGFFYDWPGRYLHGHDVLDYWQISELKKRYLQDIPLMKQMNVNTVRIYHRAIAGLDYGRTAEEVKLVLDEFYRNGIMVIMTVAISKEDLDSESYLKVVEAYKNHPAILMWSLGNEWNQNLYYGCQNVDDAARLTERAAQRIKEIDPRYHPVSSCLGDAANFSNQMRRILDLSPSVDIWGLNIYRGASFGRLFEDWKKLTLKPFYLSEFGTDSFKTSGYAVIEGYKADNCAGSEDRQMQSDFVKGLWGEIKNNLSVYNINNPCLGGLVHEFNDELWKIGSWHLGLGGINDYNNSYEAYDKEGYVIFAGHPDNVANEEYFGVVDADRNPKLIYYMLKDYYANLTVPLDPVSADINGDGRIDAMDVQLVINAALGMNIGGLNADINGDNRINAVDVQMVINAVLSGSPRNSKPNLLTTDRTIASSQSRPRLRAYRTLRAKTISNIK